MRALIELDEISKNYGSFQALDRVSLAIDSGITSLLGPNGAGKSTLIKILLGLLRASSGRGRLLEFELGRHNRQIREQVGYMPEDDCYLTGLSGVESVQLSAQLSRIPALEGLRRAHEILDFCGMAQERYRAVETYSTGMRQKLRFAQALVHDPPILILDEPTSGLDPGEREAMLNRIQILSRDKGKAVLLCTHILPDVQAVSDSVVILAQARVARGGSTGAAESADRSGAASEGAGRCGVFSCLARRSGAAGTTGSGRCPDGRGSARGARRAGLAASASGGGGSTDDRTVAKLARRNLPHGRTGAT